MESEEEEDLEDDIGEFALPFVQAGATPSKALLPSECEYSDDELRERLKLGIPPDSGFEYVARTRILSQQVPHVVVCSEEVRVRILQSTSVSSVYQPPPPVDSLAILTRHASLQSIEDSCSTFLQVRTYLSQLASFLYEEDFTPIRGGRLAAVSSSYAEGDDAPTEVEETTSPSAYDVYILPRLVTFPTSKERLQWIEFLFGLEGQGGGTAPLTHVLLQMDHVTIVRALKHVVRDAAGRAGLDDRRAAWLYALLSRLEPPFTDDMDAILRDLYRMCAKLCGGDGEEGIESALAILCLLHGVFRQFD